MVYRVAIGSLLFTYLFFIEYLPPLSRVHIPYDLEGYHYPLDDYAFQAVTHGRLPEWDPTIYSGLSAVGNAQTALFYPPTWIMFLANIGRDHLPYLSMQIFIFAHVWLAFLLCYLWLRGLEIENLACLVGAGIFAFSGYLCLQLQHLGLVAGYAWFPLGLMGIDQAAKRRDWKPLWMLAAASALCFLAGYPPTWIVFAACMVCYAVARPWQTVVAVGTLASLAFSTLLAMIQILPTLELSRYMMHEDRYGAGIKEPDFFLSYLIPNFFDFGMNVSIFANPGKEYLYLGAPALLGVVLLLWCKKPAVLAPALAIGGVSLILVINPFNAVWDVIKHSGFLAEVVRSYYFLAGITVAIVPLAACGLDAFLKRKGQPVPRPIAWVSFLLLSAWSISELVRLIHGGENFWHGWRSALDSAITVALFAFALYMLRAQRGAGRLAFTALLLLAAGIDYKAFGTSKRVNTGVGDAPVYTADGIPGLDPVAYRQIRRHPDYRLLLDPAGPFPTLLRHNGLTTPQGFDPFFPARYRELALSVGHMRGNWQFDIDPENQGALQLFGIRYVMTSEQGELYPRVQNNAAFKLVGSNNYYFKIFEYQDALPGFGWDVKSTSPATGDRAAARSIWTPEYRQFRVRSDHGGLFSLHEQFLPGWRATVDGSQVEIERWRDAFQAVSVPAGEHVVAFRYQSRGLRMGAVISFFSLIVLAIWWRRYWVARESPRLT